MSDGKLRALILTPPSAHALGEVRVRAVGSGNPASLALTFEISSRHYYNSESPTYNTIIQMQTLFYITFQWTKKP